MDISVIPGPIIELAKAGASKASSAFIDLAITRLTGKSRKVFEAEGDIEAEKVKTKWEIEKPFFVQVESLKIQRQYSNLGNTLQKSLPFVEAEISEITNDNDVFWGLLEHSKEIASEDVQDLIAKILAGEFNTPGKYHMSTLQVIKSLGKSELHLFEKVTSLLVNKNQLPKDLFTGSDNVKGLMSDFGIDFGSLQLLQSLGLFLPNDMSMGMENPLKQNYALAYFDKSLVFVSENENTKINLESFYGLSSAGSQILEFLSPKFSEQYFEWLKTNYKIPNYKLNQ